MILENLLFEGTGLTIYQDSHHLALRHSEVRHFPMPPFCPDKQTACGFSSVLNLWVDSTWQPGELIRDIVFYDNEVHDNGDYIPTYESGVHAFSLANSNRRIWIVDNWVYRNAEDGLQIYGGGRGDFAQDIYIGRNVMHHNGENAIDIKQAFDVIISQNEVYGYRKTNFPKSGSDGAAIVLNDDAPSDRLWVLFNKIYDSTVGIRSQASAHAYVIGNIFYDIHREPDQTVAISPGWAQGVASWSSSATALHVVGNTIYDVDGGIYVAHGLNHWVQNNIIAERAEDTSYHLALNTPAISFLEVSHNVLFQSVGSVRTRGDFVCQDCQQLDPLFLNAGGDDFRLLTDSPAVDAGKSSSIYQTFFDRYGLDISKDFEGKARPVDGNMDGLDAWDIGAFEFDPDAGGGPADTTPPHTVTIDSPQDTATVSGTVTISVTAQDDVAMDRVDVLLDGSLLGTDTTAPYELTWDTTQVSNDLHLLSAQAYDTSGNSTLSSAITVTVSNVTSNQPPTASFTVDPSSGDAPLTVTFDGIASTDDDGTITQYDWDFESDGVVDATGVTTTHTYEPPGDYTATLTVTDDGGESATATLSVNANDPNADPRVTVFPDQGNTLTSFVFDATAFFDPLALATQLEWDFEGDGVWDPPITRRLDRITTYIRTHVYDTPGTFAAALRITGGSVNTIRFPAVTVVNANDPGENTPPVLLNPELVPDPGIVTDSFVYRVTYQDTHNNPPASIEVTIDGTPYAMAKRPWQCSDFTTGCVYRYTFLYKRATKEGLLKDLPHDYFFTASCKVPHFQSARHRSFPLSMQSQSHNRRSLESDP